ncbi:capsular polysaccharide export protein, LipB/KpsS family [Profundibacter sp.]
MKFYLDKPNNFWVDNDGSLAEHRAVYLKLIEGILAENCEFTVFERRPYIEEALPDGCADGVYYSYHAAHPGKNCYCIKRGPFPYLWYMDAGGYSGWSAVACDADIRAQAAQFPLERAVQVIEHYKQMMLQENISILPQLKTIPEADIKSLEDYVFYPMQVNNDEVMKLADLPQFEIIREAARMAHSLQQHIVFKRHPLCTSPIITEIIKEVIDSAYVHLSVGSVNALLERARAVMVTNSTVGLQALVLGKPVFSFGKSEYDHMTNRLTTSAGLKDVFQCTDAPQSEQVKRQLGHLLDAYFVDMRDMDKIRSRIRQHRTIFEATSKEGGDAPTNIQNYRVFLTLAHRLEKESRERLEFLLATYSSLSKAEKPLVARTLSKLAYRGHQTEYIIRHSDGAVSTRALKLAQKNDDLTIHQRILRALIAKDPQDIQSLHQLGKLLYAQGDNSGGHEYAGLAAQQDNAPVNVVMFYVRRLLKDRAPNDAEIMRYARQLADNFPDNGWVQWLLARIALFEGRLDAAQTAIQYALDQDSETPIFYKLQAKITNARKNAGSS